MAQEALKPVYMVYPGLYPLLMVNYWLRRSRTPIAAIMLSDFEIKYKGRILGFFEMLLGMIQHTGFRYTFYMLLIAKWAVPIVDTWNMFRKLMGKRIKIKSYEQISREYGIPLYYSRDFNSEAVKKFLANIGANTIISAYNNQILRSAVYKIPTLGAYNIHPAMLPNFRGLDGPFEAMYHEVKNAGVTIHWIDNKIDTGRIVCQEPVKIRRDDSLFSLSVRCWMHGAKVLEKVFGMIRQGNVESRKQDPKEIQYPYQSFPDKARVRDFHKKGRKLFTIHDFVHTFKD
ncbi:MAG: formyltransferase family protein [Candidatus Omnitrophota bacterium]